MRLYGPTCTKLTKIELPRLGGEAAYDVLDHRTEVADDADDDLRYAQHLIQNVRAEYVADHLANDVGRRVRVVIVDLPFELLPHE